MHLAAACNTTSIVLNLSVIYSLLDHSLAPLLGLGTSSQEVKDVANCERFAADVWLSSYRNEYNGQW